MTTGSRKKECAIAGGLSLLLVAGLSLLFPPMYYANDDAMIRSILRGNFTGQPSSKTVYLGQIVSLMLSGLYRLLPAVPWFDLFQEGCLVASVWLVLYAGMAMVENRKRKAAVCGGLFLFFVVLLMMQITLPTYTVTAAVTGSSGILLLLLAEKTDRQGLQLRKLLPAVLLLALSYEIRQNVFFMSLPFLAAAGLWCLRGNGTLWARLRCYLPSAGLLCGLVFLGFLARSAGYSSAEWKAYESYNEARTLIYDYTGIATDEETMQKYREAGISDETISLYQRYDILFAEQQDGQTMETVAGLQDSLGKSWREAAYTYAYRMLRETTDYPFNMLAIAFYVVLFLLFAAKGRWKDILWLAMLAAVRSGLWITLIQQGRYPERIIYSLYLYEFAVLAGCLLEFVCKEKNGGKQEKTLWAAKSRYAGIFLLLLLLTVSAVSEGKNTKERYQETLSAMEETDVVYSYMEGQADTLFLLDVTSFANVPEYVFDGKSGGIDRALLLGGWMTGSPLLSQKLQSFGYENARTAFLEGEKVCYISKEPQVPVDTEKDIRQVASLSNGTDCYYVFQIEQPLNASLFGLHQRGTVVKK